jgi:hypothetical protein
MHPTVCRSFANTVSEQRRVSAIQISVPSFELTKMFPLPSSSDSVLYSTF